MAHAEKRLKQIAKSRSGGGGAVNLSSSDSDSDNEPPPPLPKKGRKTKEEKISAELAAEAAGQKVDALLAALATRGRERRRRGTHTHIRTCKFDRPF